MGWPRSLLQRSSSWFSESIWRKSWSDLMSANRQRTNDGTYNSPWNPFCWSQSSVKFTRLPSSLGNSPVKKWKHQQTHNACMLGHTIVPVSEQLLRSSVVMSSPSSPMFVGSVKPGVLPESATRTPFAFMQITSSGSSPTRANENNQPKHMYDGTYKSYHRVPCCSG